jgi:hypothetical protein
MSSSGAGRGGGGGGKKESILELAKVCISLLCCVILCACTARLSD